jgi:deoxyribodipyrimidine photo-lyase
LLQSERYDPEGTFIRQYCPELRDLDNYVIHAPYERGGIFAGQLDYPRPIIDYKRAREHAINTFKQSGRE